MGWLSLFITAVAFLAIGVIFSPKLTTLSTYVKLAHLLCFSTAFGAALWVTFIGGIIIMYRYSMSAIWKEFSSIARRFITVVAFLAIGVIFSPQTLGSKSTTLSTFLKLAHLLSFSTAFGAALWVTFIGGNIMFKNMSRHQLGDLQSKMFPAYFLMLGVCCAVSVTSFDYLHPWKTSSTTERFQLGFLLSSFLCNLANLFVFAPMIIEMMKQRHKVEIENNIGEEELLWSNDAEVAAMNKKFGMIYGLSALANIMSIGCLAIHSMYLAEICRGISFGTCKARCFRRISRWWVSAVPYQWLPLATFTRGKLPPPLRDTNLGFCSLPLRLTYQHVCLYTHDH